MFLDFYTDLGFFILRFAVGIIFISHAIPKIRKRKTPFEAGWLNLILGLIELLAGLLVISGIWIRIGAGILFAISLGAMFFHIFLWKDKFRNGWDLAFLLFASSLLLVLTAGGNWRIIF